MTDGPQKRSGGTPGKRFKDERQGIRCKATNQRTGEACKGWAVYGQLVCIKHGGATPQARKAAAMRAAEEKAAKLLIAFGAAPVVNSLEELQRLAGEIVAWKDTCRKMVNDLHLQEEGLRYESSQRLEQVRSEVVLWERSLDRAASILTALVRLGLDERLVGVKEKTAENIAASLAAALAKAGIDPEAANVVRREFGRKLRIIEAA